MIVTDQNWRPQSLSQFVGQPKLIARLKTEIEASRRDNRPMGHILLAGAAGSGKSLLAPLIAKERGVKLIRMTGKQLTHMLIGHILLGAPDVSPSFHLDLHGFAVRNNRIFPTGEATRPSLIFVDEANTISPTSLWEETIYHLMENNDGNKTIRMRYRWGQMCELDVLPHTWMFATNRLGAMQKAAPGLRRRCRFVESIEPYEITELQGAVMQYAKCQGWHVTDEAAEALARRSNGFPGPTVELFKAVQAHVTVHSQGRSVSTDDVIAAMDANEIDELGLNKIQQRYLRLLYEASGTASLEDIAIRLDEPETKTVEVEVERPLIRMGLVSKSSKGRTLTPKGFTHVTASTPNAGRMARPI